MKTRKSSASVTHLESLLRKTEADSLKDGAASLKGTSPLAALLSLRNAPLLLLLVAAVPFFMHHHHHAAAADGEPGLTLPHGLTRRTVHETTVVGGAAAGQQPPPPVVVGAGHPAGERHAGDRDRGQRSAGGTGGHRAAGGGHHGGGEHHGRGRAPSRRVAAAAGAFAAPPQMHGLGAVEGDNQQTTSTAASTPAAPPVGAAMPVLGAAAVSSPPQMIIRYDQFPPMHGHHSSHYHGKGGHHRHGGRTATARMAADEEDQVQEEGEPHGELGDDDDPFVREAIADLTTASAADDQPTGDRPIIDPQNHERWGGLMRNLARADDMRRLKQTLAESRPVDFHWERIHAEAAEAGRMLPPRHSKLGVHRAPAALPRSSEALRNCTLLKPRASFGGGPHPEEEEGAGGGGEVGYNGTEEAAGASEPGTELLAAAALCRLPPPTFTEIVYEVVQVPGRALKYSPVRDEDGSCSAGNVIEQMANMRDLNSDDMRYIEMLWSVLELEAVVLRVAGQLANCSWDAGCPEAPPPSPPPPIKPPPVQLSAEELAAAADLKAKRGIDALKERLARAKATLFEHDRSEDAKLEANLLDQGVSMVSSDPPPSVVSQGDETTGFHTDATHVDLLSPMSLASGSVGPGGSGGDSSSSLLVGSSGSLFDNADEANHNAFLDDASKITNDSQRELQKLRGQSRYLAWGRRRRRLQSTTQWSTDVMQRIHNKMNEETQQEDAGWLGSAQRSGSGDGGGGGGGGGGGKLSQKERLMMSLNKPYNASLVHERPRTSVIAHRGIFRPADWATNDGYCPFKVRRNPKLGHVPNCSMEQRRPAKTDELQSQMVIFDVAQRRDETLRDAPGMAMRLHFKQELLAMLPRSDLNVRYRSCAVVGNSGALHDSSLGWEIDARDAVMRMNYAPTSGFEADVGTRTTFDFINQQHTKAFIPRVRAAGGGQAPASLRSPLRNSTVTLFEVTSPFARYHLYAPLLHHFSRVREERRLDIRVVIESPDLVAHTYRVWSKLKRAIELAATAGRFTQLRYQGKPMTGFFATIFALQVCEEVHLYGFSPYQGQQELARYHYFDEVTGVTAHHSFDLAYEMFRQLAIWPCSGANITMHD